jgi:tRNA A37 threonylcarbamoyladenosine modification protein TsaB
MLILVLDASTPVVSVALAEEDRVLTEISVSARGASEALLPAVDAALTSPGRSLPP